MATTVGEEVAAVGAKGGVLVGCKGEATEQACKINASRTGNQIILETCFIAESTLQF